ncbi:MAG: hypothetical protein Ta2F_04270 [Termitinemataceae bacterium]|nr:MAG: hypothetical protein Ta2F_04270 [Termitinemataceae bacterium]
MFLLHNKKHSASGIFIVFCMLIFAGCGFANLHPVIVYTNPSTANEILDSVWTPVIISFDTEMDKLQTEKLAGISSYLGNMECDTHWEGNSLIFVPVAGWTPGVRYVLSGSGTAVSTDNREVPLSIYVPFYALTNGAAPYIVSFDPADSASVGVTKEEGGRVHLVFSQPMNKQSVEDNFLSENITKKEFVWNTEFTELTVSSKEKLNAWTVIKWSLSNKACDEFGIPIVKEISAQFTTDIDIKLPKVLSVFPAIKSDSSLTGSDAYRWIPTGLNIEDGLGALNGICVKFSKPIDNKTVSNCLRFEPSLSGIIDQFCADTIVFIPSTFPQTAVKYRLTVSGDVKDTYGLKLENEYQTNFIADIPYLKIINIDLVGNNHTVLSEEQISSETTASVSINAADRNLLCIVDFSLPINDLSHKTEFVNSIRFETFFPGGLSPVALINARWLDGGISGKLKFEWSGLEIGTTTSPKIYKLYFPGGTSGLTNGLGSYLKESITIYLEAQ